MKKIKHSLFALTTIAFLFASCTKNKMNSNLYSTEYAIEDSINTTMPMLSAKQTRANQVLEEPLQELLQRKLILTGFANIEVNSISSLDKTMEQWAKKFGGYVSSSNWDETSFNATVKIPADKFYDAMTSTSDFGKIKNHSINTSDVTDDFYDLESRIETKKILRDKLKNYLTQAQNLKEMLEIERQLNNTESELESIEGRMKRLSNEIDFSTININCNLPVGQTENGWGFPDFGEGFREFGKNFFSFVKIFAFGILYLIVFGIPLIAFGLFLFWLLFGKIGIIRKLISKLKK